MEHGRLNVHGRSRPGQTARVALFRVAQALGSAPLAGYLPNLGPAWI